MFVASAVLDWFLSEANKQEDLQRGQSSPFMIPTFSLFGLSVLFLFWFLEGFPNTGIRLLLLAFVHFGGILSFDFCRHDLFLRSQLEKNKHPLGILRNCKTDKMRLVSQKQLRKMYSAAQLQTSWTELKYKIVLSKHIFIKELLDICKFVPAEVNSFSSTSTKYIYMSCR